MEDIWGGLVGLDQRCQAGKELEPVLVTGNISTLLEAVETSFNITQGRKRNQEKLGLEGKNGSGVFWGQVWICGEEKRKRTLYTLNPGGTAAEKEVNNSREAGSTDAWRARCSSDGKSDQKGPSYFHTQT